MKSEGKIWWLRGRRTEREDEEGMGLRAFLNEHTLLLGERCEEVW